MKWFFTLVNFMLVGLVFAGMETGTLTGKITDRNNLQPLAGANIVLEEKSLGTTSDPNGKFSLEGLEPGSYNISIHYLGYKKVLKSNVIINPASITFMKVEMEADILESETIEVSASFLRIPKKRRLAAVVWILKKSAVVPAPTLIFRKQCKLCLRSFRVAIRPMKLSPAEAIPAKTFF